VPARLLSIDVAWRSSMPSTPARRAFRPSFSRPLLLADAPRSMRTCWAGFKTVTVFAAMLGHIIMLAQGGIRS